MAAPGRVQEPVLLCHALGFSRLKGGELPGSPNLGAYGTWLCAAPLELAEVYPFHSSATKR